MHALSIILFTSLILIAKFFKKYCSDLCPFFACNYNESREHPCGMFVNAARMIARNIQSLNILIILSYY